MSEPSDVEDAKQDVVIEHEATTRPEAIEDESVIVEVPDTAGQSIAEEKEPSVGGLAEEAIEAAVEDLVDKAACAAGEAIGKVIEKSADSIDSEAAATVMKEICKEAGEDIVEGIADSAQTALLESKDEVLEALKEKARELGVKKSTLAIIIKFVMEAVEETPLKGKEQKDYALRLMRALVEDLATGEDKEFLLIALDSGSVADTIDLVAAAAKGNLNVNKVVVAASRSCIPAMLACFSRKKH